MKNLPGIFAVLFALFFAPSIATAAVGMTGTASVNITSDTSVNAKNMAMAEARRQIITDVLGKYADGATLGVAVADARDATLADMISSTGISGERLSATTYSANISMTIDRAAAHRWLGENNVPNWLGGDDSVVANQLTLVLDVAGGLRDWVELGAAMREQNITPVVKRISNGTVVANIPVTGRAAFVGAARGAGWRTADADGFLRIWK